MVKEGGIWKMGFYQVYLVSAIFLVLCWSKMVAVTRKQELMCVGHCCYAECKVNSALLGLNSTDLVAWLAVG